MRTRAADGDVDGQAVSTRARYASDIGRWTKHAASLRISPALPTVEDLIRYLETIRKERGPVRAASVSNSLASYFRRLGVPVLVHHPDVQAAVEGDWNPAERPLGARVGGPPGSRRRRAQRCADEAYAAYTHEQYRRFALRWVEWCRNRQVDPYHPGLDVFIAYVGTLGSRYAAQTVVNNLNGLSRYFSKAGVDDLARDDKVRLIAKGQSRKKPPRAPAKVSLDDLRAMMATLKWRNPRDVRNGLMLLCMGLHGLAARHIQALEVTRRVEKEDGVLFFTDVPRLREVLIGELQDPLLSVKRWLSRWLGLIEDVPGPLFPRATLEGTFEMEPLSAQNINAIVKSIASRAGIDMTNFSANALRRGFLVRVWNVAGPVAAAKAGGYRSVKTAAQPIKKWAPSTAQTRERDLRANALPARRTAGIARGRARP